MSRFSKKVMESADKAKNEGDYRALAEMTDEIKEMISERVYSINSIENPNKAMNEVKELYNLKNRIENILFDD